MAPAQFLEFGIQCGKPSILPSMNYQLSCGIRPGARDAGFGGGCGLRGTGEPTNFADHITQSQGLKTLRLDRGPDRQEMAVFCLHAVEHGFSLFDTEVGGYNAAGLPLTSNAWGIDVPQLPSNSSCGSTGNAPLDCTL